MRTNTFLSIIGVLLAGCTQRESAIISQLVVANPGAVGELVELVESHGPNRNSTLAPPVVSRRTGFEAYDAAITNAVIERWQHLLDTVPLDPAASSVVLQFQLTYQGLITNMTVTSSDASQQLVLLCQRAVLESSPFPPWTLDMRRAMGNSRRITFSFTCSAPQSASRPRDTQRRTKYVKTHPDLAPAINKAIRAGKVRLGMTHDEVRASWGPPKNATNTFSKSGGGHVWHFYKRVLFFEDGRLVKWEAEP